MADADSELQKGDRVTCSAAYLLRNIDGLVLCECS